MTTGQIPPQRRSAIIGISVAAAVLMAVIALIVAMTRGDGAQQYLGYQNVDKVIKTSVQGSEALVSVGFDNRNGGPATAAVLHLVRLGSGPDAPWEVVGTADSALTLTAPAYGSTVTSPIAAGGRVTGVDDSLRVQVSQIGRTGPVGEIGGLPAGGTSTPWTATVPFAASCPGTLTVAVATGGHVAEVERFAITGVAC